MLPSLRKKRGDAKEREGARPNRRRVQPSAREATPGESETRSKTRVGSKASKGSGEGRSVRLPRIGRALLKLTASTAMAYALLLGAQEAYEYATTSARFEARKLIYEPTRHVSDDKLRTLLALEGGTNILALDLEALSERIVSHPWVSHATVVRHLPDTLEVSVSEHEATAVLAAGKFYLVDKEGKPFKEVERGERGQLPIITGIRREELHSGPEHASAKSRRAMMILAAYREKQRPRLGEIHLEEDGGVSLYTASSGTQLRLGRMDTEFAFARFDALRAALGSRADRLAVVHLDSDRASGRDRIVARFQSERDDALLLAQGIAPEESALSKGAPKKTGPEKAGRMPRYD